MILFYFFVFILGTLIGSFLNVVVLRYGTGRSIVNNRSTCFSCGETLKWFELIPVLSFILQFGKCRNCKSKISKQYISVEILTGLVFLSVYLKIIPDFYTFYENFISLIYPLLFYWTIFSILIAISVYDLRHKIIPNGLVYTFIILSFLGGLILMSRTPLDIGMAGLAIVAPFFLLWLASNGRWMGFGDVKLALGIGLFLGLQNGVYAVIWSFWVGGSVSILLLFFTAISKKFVNISKLSLLSKSFTIKSEIPFGPFLVLGTAVAFFADWDFLNFKILLDLFF